MLTTNEQIVVALPSVVIPSLHQSLSGVFDRKEPRSKISEGDVETAPQSPLQVVQTYSLTVTPSGTAKKCHCNQMVPYCVTITGVAVSEYVRIYSFVFAKVQPNCNDLELTSAKRSYGAALPDSYNSEAGGQGARQVGTSVRTRL